MEEKEFNELVSKIEAATSQKVTATVKESLKDLDTNAVKELLSKEIATKEDLENVLKNEAFTNLEKQMKETIENVNQMKDLNKSDAKPVSVAKQLKENKDVLKQLAKGSTSAKEVVIKADTLRASVTGNQNALDLAGLGQLAHAKLTAYDIFNRIPVSDNNTNGVIRYYDWDSATIARAADTIAEGAAFPESTAKWVTKTLTLEKIGDTLPVSEEFFEDSGMFAAELDMFLNTNVQIVRNDQLINGDGITPNLKGLVTTVPAYTAPTAGISDASIYDLFVKVSEDITATGGSKYSPNFGLMNISDINLMKLKKDANDNYIIPPFVSRDGSVVAGMVVLEDNDIVANTMVIGDSRYARIYERVGITMSRGVVDAQFAEDMETLKVRTRLAFLIRGADEGGFRKVASISASLALLATP